MCSYLCTHFSRFFFSTIRTNGCCKLRLFHLGSINWSEKKIAPFFVRSLYIHFLYKIHFYLVNNLHAERKSIMVLLLVEYRVYSQIRFDLLSCQIKHINQKEAKLKFHSFSNGMENKVEGKIPAYFCLLNFD